jgi:hypothetical protein
MLVAVISAKGSPGASTVALGLATMGDRLQLMLRALAARHGSVVVDAGRWQPPSPVDRLLTAADVVLIVARPVPEEIRQVDVRLRPLRDLTADVRLLLVGERGVWPPAEIAGALRVRVAQVLPLDRDGAGVLAGRAVPRKGWTSTGWTRLPLLAACHTLARRLAGATTAVGRAPAPLMALNALARHQPNGQAVPQ